MFQLMPSASKDIDWRTDTYRHGIDTTQKKLTIGYNKLNALLGNST